MPHDFIAEAPKAPLERRPGAAFKIEINHLANHKAASCRRTPQAPSAPPNKHCAALGLLPALCAPLCAAGQSYAPWACSVTCLESQSVPQHLTNCVIIPWLTLFNTLASPPLGANTDCYVNLGPSVPRNLPRQRIVIPSRQAGYRLIAQHSL